MHPSHWKVHRPTMSMYCIMHNAKREFFSLLPEWFGYCTVKRRHIEKHENYFDRVKRMSRLILPYYRNMLKYLFSVHSKDDTSKLEKHENLWHTSVWFSDCSFGYNTFMFLIHVFLFKVFLVNCFKFYTFLFSLSF